MIEIEVARTTVVFCAHHSQMEEGPVPSRHCTRPQSIIESVRTVPIHKGKDYKEEETGVVVLNDFTLDPLSLVSVTRE